MSDSRSESFSQIYWQFFSRNLFDISCFGKKSKSYLYTNAHLVDFQEHRDIYPSHVVETTRM